ncbi:ATP-binding protein [Ihubacter massiliensis]|uniref:ATP-binding protein n=1 Tax=Hominibacterium faecale TaxID=2839743 RepID=A0A9J6QTP7_9FIRM|nr:MULTISPECIES: ATP-binding protein [Eubacteriales Family XIII. Incertae Sedis]MCO7123383.1 ATP-binding protein [Ihubacter massiliensis]MCU7379674.1 ATP-binding protein [Hominibacterium faecale]
MDTITLPAKIKALYQALAFIEKAAQSCGWEGDRAKLELMAEEIFVNIAGYAYGGEEGLIQISCGAEKGMFLMQFRDRGKPFDPLKQPEPDLQSPAGQRPIGGLGVYLTKTCADRVSYQYEDGTNILTVGMYLQKEEHYENH